MRQEVENPMVNDKLWNDGERHAGSDWSGNEVFVGDEVFHDPETDEIVSEEGLLDYLKATYGIDKITVK